ncbi:MAG: ATP-binding cassette domain-containing protein [Magnetospirillum sp.]|jgi:tungstate transport system ATP-binding protein|nr:ATP-binding cassette domain-containing protein [Magnetospirillum sp.]
MILPLIFDDARYEIGGRTLLATGELRLTPGARTAVIGHNGAGKTTLLRLAHGLIAPTSGTVRWAAPAEGRHAMVFQRPAMLRRSALANVAYGLKLRGLDAAERERIAQDRLARVGLANLAQTPARVLSGGEQQRVALARAWALAPEVLFLDEPTASLDPGATRAVETIMDDMSREGAKIVFTTHNLGQARRLSDEIVFLAGGRVIERAATADFFRNPRSAEAAEYLRGELP